MRLPTCDSWGCRFILPSAAALIVTTGANLVNNSHPIRRVWSFNYYILNWILDTIKLVYFITVLSYLILISITDYDRNYLTIVCFGFKLSCVIVIAITFQVTSIPVETILITHHFITCCVYLHIGINSIWLQNLPTIPHLSPKVLPTHTITQFWY